jgi:6-O-methylguanine DNA methyltransferase, DNA binding domain
LEGKIHLVKLCGMKTRTSWREKMDNPNLPKVVDMPPRMKKRLGSGSLLVPSPREVDSAIRTVRKGSVTTVSQIRSYLAGKFGTDATCPLTTGIFIRIAAEAAEEEEGQGKSRVTPYWRVVKDDGSLNPKFPGGVKRQAERLREEGHRVVAGGGKRAPKVVLD